MKKFLAFALAAVVTYLTNAQPDHKGSKAEGARWVDDAPPSPAEPDPTGQVAGFTAGYNLCVVDRQVQDASGRWVMRRLLVVPFDHTRPVGGGFEAGDQILLLPGRRCEGAWDWHGFGWDYLRPGAAVEVVVFRRWRPVVVTLTIKER